MRRMLRLERVRHVVSLGRILPVVKHRSNVYTARHVSDPQGRSALEDVRPGSARLQDFVKQGPSYLLSGVVLLPEQLLLRDLASACAGGGSHSADRDTLVPPKCCGVVARSLWPAR